jgi:molybdopterin-containing oxidoreductase family iron-sulfur binding subunit
VTNKKIPVKQPADQSPCACSNPEPTHTSDEEISTSRRGFVKNMGGLSVASLMGTAALLTNSDDAQANTEWGEWFQGNYRLMTDEEKARAVARLERRYSIEYDKKVTVDSTGAQEGVLFGYALNIQKCIGCRRCVKACVQENNQSRGEREIEWIRVLKMEKGEFTVKKMKDGYPGDYGIQVGGNAYNAAGVVLEGEHYYQPEKVPDEDAFYMPIACMQCEKPPCVKVCPVRTTYREPDGPVVVDYNWCIGCRMCIGACPYWARRFNWGKPNLPKEEIGNLLDPNSEVRQILAKKRVFRLKAELNTYPKFFYFID